ncbi:MAG: hypothetical protein AAFR40_17955 [Pseudomonadota bacterium]
MTTEMDKDTLAAFVDCALSPEESARVVMHLADHPEDQAYVDKLTLLNAELAEAFSEPLHEPVPEAIRATIYAPTDVTDESGTVVPLGRPTRRNAVWAGLGGLATAAAAVLALAVLPNGGEGARHVAAGVVDPGSALHVSLDGLTSGQQRTLGEDATLSMVASFDDTQEGLCREFHVLFETTETFEHGIACRTAPEEWTVEIVVVQQGAVSEDSGGYVPASGPGSQAIEQMLDALGAGLALTEAEEEALMATGWQ